MRLVAGFLLGIVLMAVGAAPGIGADDPVVYTATYVEVGPSSAPQGANLLRGYRERGRRDEGNLRLDVLQRLDRPNQFVVLGVWRSQAALQSHAAGALATELKAKLQPLLASPSDERLHIALSVVSGPPATGPSVLHVVTHVDVI